MFIKIWRIKLNRWYRQLTGKSEPWQNTPLHAFIKEGEPLSGVVSQFTGDDGVIPQFTREG